VEKTEQPWAGCFTEPRKEKGGGRGEARGGKGGRGDVKVREGGGTAPTKGTGRKKISPILKREEGIDQG